MELVKRAIKHAQVLKPSVERAGERSASAVVVGHCVCSQKLGLTLPFPSPLSDFLPQNPWCFTIRQRFMRGFEFLLPSTHTCRGFMGTARCCPAPDAKLFVGWGLRALSHQHRSIPLLFRGSQVPPNHPSSWGDNLVCSFGTHEHADGLFEVGSGSSLTFARGWGAWIHPKTLCKPSPGLGLGLGLGKTPCPLLFQVFMETPHRCTTWVVDGHCPTARLGLSFPNFWALPGPRLGLSKLSNNLAKRAFQSQCLLQQEKGCPGGENPTSWQR